MQTNTNTYTQADALLGGLLVEEYRELLDFSQTEEADAPYLVADDSVAVCCQSKSCVTSASTTCNVCTSVNNPPPDKKSTLGWIDLPRA